LVTAQVLQPSTELEKDKSLIPPASFRLEEMPGANAPSLADDLIDPFHPMAPDVTYSYFFVSGPELQPRTSTNTQVYSSSGCVYMSTGASTGLLTGAGLHIPNGSVIKFLTLYYNDTHSSNGVDAFLTRYAPGSNTSDIISTGSTNAEASGYSLVTSAEITHTVNNTNYAYMVYGWPDIASSQLQVCGIRVAYIAPSMFGIALPLIQR
jgi:hypothetical protein